MRMLDIIHTKREGGQLSPEQLQFFLLTGSLMDQFRNTKRVPC